MPPPYRKSLVDLSMGKIRKMSQSDPPSLGCLGLSGRNSFKQKTVKLTNSKNSHIHRVRRKDTRNTYWSIEPTIIIYGIGQRYTGAVTGIVVHPTGIYFLYIPRVCWLTHPPIIEFFELDNLAVFCSKPPAARESRLGFEGLDRDIPTFPIETSMQVKGFSYGGGTNGLQGTRHDAFRSCPGDTIPRDPGPLLSILPSSDVKSFNDLQ
jgi:hypothetical protein